MHYVLIKGPSYGDNPFEERERIREGLRKELEDNGVLFVEYNWVWDEEDRCLLLVGQYEKIEDGRLWIEALESMGFEIVVRTDLPGGEEP